MADEPEPAPTRKLTVDIPEGLALRMGRLKLDTRATLTEQTIAALEAWLTEKGY